MKKLLFLLIVLFFSVTTSFAAPIAGGDWVDYEYYQNTDLNESGYPGQFVQEGDSFSFFFDLLFLNNSTGIPFAPTGTDSTLTLMNDVFGYGPVGTPVGDLWASISIFSVDQQWEQFDIDLTAFYNGIEYDLAAQIVALGGNSDTATFTYAFAGDLLSAWQSDPFGLLELNVASVFENEMLGYNDFNLLEVGVGVAPVPEPSTLLLLGGGLIGLAYYRRRK